MRVISKRRLREFWVIHPHTEAALLKWYREALAGRWQNFAETRRTFPDADQVKLKSRRVATVFNVARTGSRIIAELNDRFGVVYLRFVLTHAEYEAGKWKEKL